ncbi:hypothetical protein [Streptomyces sp. S8]|uniref:hypothetical protein n=1 Tax=Streptomyces sp. S8 TaxID=1837283 RepID=UPI0031B58911
MADPAHRAGRERRRRDQLRGVQRLRAVARAVRRDRGGLRGGAGRARGPGRGRADRASPVHGADDGHRVRGGQHRRALRRLRARRRGPDPGGDLGLRDQGLLRPGQGGYPRRPADRRHRRLTGRTSRSPEAPVLAGRGPPAYGRPVSPRAGPGCPRGRPAGRRGPGRGGGRSGPGCRPRR